MSTMSVKEALTAVLEDMRAMSPQQLREELLSHKDGEIAKTLREAENFLHTSFSLFSYPITYIQALLQEDLTDHSIKCSLEGLQEFLAANDGSYTLAA